MPEIAAIIAFAIAAFVLLVVPGPAVLYIVARGIDQGRGAAMVSVLGVQTGASVHVIAAAAGLSAILVSSAVAFSIVKYAGAAYLIYLGIRTLLDRSQEQDVAVGRRLSNRRIFGQSIVVEMLNPKTALFFFAFLPQFVDVSRGAVAAQVLFFGGLWITLAMVTDGLYALLAGSVGGWLRGNPGFLHIQRYVAGGTYLVLGILTALSSPNRSK